MPRKSSRPSRASAPETGEEKQQPDQGAPVGAAGPAGASGDQYQLSGDFRGATINIKSTIVTNAEAEGQEGQPPAPGAPPFQGLQYFDEKDADRFFGREALTAKLISRLQSTRFLAIIGASGSGKSSLVRAGVIPALRRGMRLQDGSLPPAGSANWEVAVMTPSSHPLEALAAALSPDSLAGMAALQAELLHQPAALRLAVRQRLASVSKNHLLLVVDQFEEVFSLCRHPEERKAFLDNLVAAADPSDAQPVTILLVLRADFYSHVSEHDGLRDLVSRQQEFIGAMSREELTLAIVKPAALGGWKIQEGLVELMLNDIGNEPGALPLLSHALLETWTRRRGRTMTLSGYNESGGVRGAIARTAEHVFRQRLTPEQQAIARMIFVRLTELEEGAQATRRRATFSELITRASDPDVINAVLDILAEARLVTTGIQEPGEVKVVEVAHEALIREWPTLQEWIEQDREGLILHRQLTEDTNDWMRWNRDPGALYRGMRLQQVVKWASDETNAAMLSLQEQEFLEASQRQAKLEAERERQHSAGIWRRRILTASFSAAALLAVVLFYWVITGGINPFQKPASMSGLFNIAVAEIGRTGPDGQVTAAENEAGVRLSERIYDTLVGQAQKLPGNLNGGIQVWRDSPELARQKVKIGRVEGRTPEEQNAAAAALAGRLKADLLVYGTMDTRTQPAQLGLRFWIAPQLDYNFEDLQGNYQLGKPIAVFDPADPGLEVQSELNSQSGALTWITIGLTYELLGRSNQALEAFHQAEALLPDSEILQFFIGREHLFISQHNSADPAADQQAAEEAFRQAIALDDRYARAHIGLAGVFFARAQHWLLEHNSDHEAGVDAQVFEWIDAAVASYTRVLEQDDPGRNYGFPIESVARMGLGLCYRLQGEAYSRAGEAEKASQALDRSVQVLQGVLQPLADAQQHRFLAQAYQGLGSAYHWQAYLAELAADSQQSKALYQQAIQSYDQCVAQGEQFPLDQILKDEVINRLCVPNRADAQQRYDAIAGGSG